MKKSFIVFLYAIFFMLHVLPGSDNEILIPILEKRTNNNNIVPIGCKNLGKIGSFSGTCSANANFQLFAAALNYLSRNKLPELSASNDLGKYLKNDFESYRKKQGEDSKKPFTINQGLFLWNDAHREEYILKSALESLKLNNKDEKLFLHIPVTTKETYYISNNAPTLQKTNLKKDLENKLKKIIKESNCNKSPILFLTTVEDISQEDINHFPANFPDLVLNEQQRYKLVGIRYFHEITEDIMNKVKSREPSPCGCGCKCIYQKWTRHLDAFVNYQGKWYLMDDESRWEVAACNADLKDDSFNSNKILKAISNSYPGCAGAWMYVPTQENQGDNDLNNSQNEGKLHIKLHRETPGPSLLFPKAAIATGGILKGLCCSLTFNSLIYALIALNDDADLNFSTLFPTFLIIGFPVLLTCCAVTIAKDNKRLESAFTNNRSYGPSDRANSFGPQEGYTIDII